MECLTGYVMLECDLVAFNALGPVLTFAEIYTWAESSRMNPKLK